MAWPQPSDYHEAIQAPGICFRDPVLRSSMPTLDRRGLPKVITGNFASVYQMTSGESRFAVRCFLTYFEDQERRYEAISTELERLDLPFMVGFKFEHEGILVGGNWYPILRMDWVEGTGLNQYIASNLDDPPRLLRLAQRFVACVDALEQSGLAHGDLQHGNILVQGDGSVKLIDYDGMYVPALKGFGSHELGHASYQHPGRDSHKSFGPHGDRFSAWLICVSLVALMLEPTLWFDFNVGEDRLLFAQSDLTAPSTSLVFARLESSHIAGVRTAAHALRSLLAIPADAMPPLPASLVTDVKLPEGSANQEGMSVDAVGPSKSGFAVVGLGPSWVQDHMPPVSAVRFVGAFGAQRLTLGVGIGTVLAFLAASAFGAMAGPVAILIAIVISITVGIVIRHDLRGRPEWQAKAGRRLALREADRRLRDVRHAIKAAEQKRGTEEEGERTQLKALDGKLGKARSRRDASIARLAGDSQRKIGQLKITLAEVDRKERESLAAALDRLRQEYFDQALRAYSIHSASVAGIGSALKTRLARAGLLTAADMKDVRIRQVGSAHYRYRKEVTELRIGNTWRHIEGVGRAKASALVQWRMDVERKADHRSPKQLSPSQRASIIAQTEVQRRDVTRQIADAEQLVQQRISAVRQTFVTEQRAIEAESARTRATFASTYRALEAEDGSLRRKLQAAEWAKGVADREFNRFRMVTIRAYLALTAGLGR